MKSFVKFGVFAMLVACNKDAATTTTTAATTTTTTTTAAATATTPAVATTTAAPVVTAPALTEYDLSTVNAKWKGWTVKAPEGAKVMGDLGTRARVAGKTVDFNLNQDKPDLAGKRKMMEGIKSPDVKFAFTKQTPDALEWSIESNGHTSYSFVHVQHVGKATVQCEPENAGSQDDLKAIDAACATVAKN